MARILVVEDEPAMRSGLCDNLEFEGYAVDSADRGDDGLKKLEMEDFDLVLLDVMLPGLSGFDVLKQLRRMGNNTPVILLTAKGEEMDKVRGLELGADDYITKPFSLRELLARVKANLRRSAAQVTDRNEGGGVDIGRLLVNFDALEATDHGVHVKLSHKEFEILHYLYKKKNQIVTRDDLLDKVWGSDYQPASRTIDNFILRLRQKIDTVETNHIVTVHGMGYKLVL
ncbi:MAG: response regulator transcription factor [Prolixibacteraceae bacterium]|nr:response regulator transcription factor [Prolixibacteraceae bacterium]